MLLILGQPSLLVRARSVFVIYHLMRNFPVPSGVVFLTYSLKAVSSFHHRHFWEWFHIMYLRHIRASSSLQNIIHTSCPLTLYIYLGM